MCECIYLCIEVCWKVRRRSPNSRFAPAPRRRVRATWVAWPARCPTHGAPCPDASRHCVLLQPRTGSFTASDRDRLTVNVTCDYDVPPNTSPSSRRCQGRRSSTRARSFKSAALKTVTQKAKIVAWVWKVVLLTISSLYNGVITSEVSTVWRYGNSIIAWPFSDFFYSKTGFLTLVLPNLTDLDKILHTPIFVRKPLVGRLRPRSARGWLQAKPERLVFFVILVTHTKSYIETTDRRDFGGKPSKWR